MNKNIMSVHEYKLILTRAKQVKEQVLKNYETKINLAWSYYFAKSILNPKKNITKFGINQAKSNTSGDYFSRQITKIQFTDMAKRFTKYVETNKQLPLYITVSPNRKMNVLDYTFMFARLLIYQDSTNKLPDSITVNSKYFVKPSEPYDVVYNYFVKVFGNFGNSIDEALEKVDGNGYGYYYDDTYSNKTSIDRMKKGYGVNCTDSCQVFYNIAKKLGYEVHCLHIQCRGGDGHVRLKLRHKTNTGNNWIYRDPASVLSGNGVSSNWCSDGYLLDTDPSWFMENLNR